MQDKAASGTSPAGSPHPRASAQSSALLIYAAEGIGTFMLVLVGTAVATAAALGKGTAGPAYNSLAVALSFGVILTPIVGALGPVSGAHVNPAVNLGLAAGRQVPLAASAGLRDRADPGRHRRGARRVGNLRPRRLF